MRALQPKQHLGVVLAATHPSVIAVVEQTVQMRRRDVVFGSSGRRQALGCAKAIQFGIIAGRGRFDFFVLCARPSIQCRKLILFRVRL